MKTNTFFSERGAANTILVVIICVLLAALTAVGGYLAGSKNAKDELDAKQEEIDSLSRKLKASPDANPLMGDASQSASNQQSGGDTTTYSSANLGFTVNVPQAWAGKWKYSESANIGISTASVTFFLINKDTKYQEVVTIGKIPQNKYDDAKAQGAAVGNADNYLGKIGDSAIVMTFPDGTVGDYKDFTYADAVKAARESFRASFKPL